MKKVLLFLTSLCVFNGVIFSQWTLLHPKPTNEALYGSYFIDSLQGYFIGHGGTIIKTTDGCNTWATQNSGVPSSLRAACFTSLQSGVIVGDLGIILKTSDGGNTWINVTQYDPDLFAVCFPSSSVGYAAGKVGTIIKTTDGGDTWTHCPYASEDLTDICFTSIDTGFAAGSAGLIFKTSNGGITWTTQNPFPNPLHQTGLNCISFPSTDTGYISGWDLTDGKGFILKSTDKGNTWTKIGSGIQFGPQITFPSVNTGYSLWGDIGAAYLFKTVDGGLTWTNYLLCSFTSGSYLSFNIFFRNENTGYASGDKGIILKTTDGAASWSEMEDPFRPGFISVAFTDDSTGYFITAQSVYKTTDAGVHWDSVFSPGSSTILYPLSGIFFSSPNTGYLVQDQDLWKTTDAGLTWTMLPHIQPAWGINNIYFKNDLTGFKSTGYPNYIFRTTDGGNTWTQDPLPCQSCIPTLLRFVNDSVGHLFAYDQSNLYTTQMFRTLDGGNTWTYWPSCLPYLWYDFWFTDQYNGYLGGEGWWQSEKYRIYRTTNGGTNCYDKTAYGMEPIRIVRFITPDNGYISDGCIIYHTPDGGYSWINEYQVPSVGIYEITPTSNYVYAFGGMGTIIRCQNPFPVGITQPNPEKNGLTLEIYPNPASKNLTVEFPEYLVIKSGGTGAQSTGIYHQWTTTILEVYDLYGRNVFSKEISKVQTSLEIDVSDWHPGMYLFRLVYNKHTVADTKVIIQ